MECEFLHQKQAVNYIGFPMSTDAVQRQRYNFFIMSFEFFLLCKVAETCQFLNVCFIGAYVRRHSKNIGTTENDHATKNRISAVFCLLVSTIRSGA